MKRIDVAVGLLRDEQGRVLVGQRTVEDLYLHKWEFPGGKFEEGETAEQALRRELHEEIGVSVSRCTPCQIIEHDYPDRRVRLHVMWVMQYEGDARACEGQALQWLAPSELTQIDLLEGNQAIIDLLAA